MLATEARACNCMYSKTVRDEKRKEITSQGAEHEEQRKPIKGAGSET